MRPGRDDEPRGGSSPDERLEAFLGRFLARYPRFFLYLGLGLGALVVLGLVLAKVIG